MAAGTLEVVQTLQRVGGQLRFLPPKTEDSPRTVPLPDFCLQAPKEHAERQADEHDGAGDKWRDHGLVFPTRGRNADGAGQPSPELGPHLKRELGPHLNGETTPASQSRLRQPKALDAGACSRRSARSGCTWPPRAMATRSHPVITLRNDHCLRSARQSRRSGLFGRGGVLRSRPLVTGDSAAASHCAQPLPICSAGRITARSRRGVVAAGLVTLALAARDQRLRNRPLAALSWRLLKGREPGGTPRGNRNLGNGRRGRTGERRTTGNQRKAGEGGEPGGQTGNRRKARGGNRRT